MGLKHLAIGVLVALMTLSAIAAGGHVTASAASAAITLKPSSGPPTSTTVVSGSGFGAGELVDVYFDNTDALLASASSTGTFKVKLHVPASAQPGDHYVTAAGRTSALSAQRTFTVRTNWPEYGFNASGDSSNPYENTLGVGSVPNLQESFTFAAGSQVTGVSVVNGVAYVATFGGTVYAVNATTGAKKWSFATGAEVNVTPAVSGNTVFFGTYGGPGKVYALNASTGAPIWTDDLSSQESNGFTGSPIVVGGLVYIGGESGNEYALNAANGFAQWAFPTGCCFTTTAAYGDGLVYVGPASGGTLYALNASTGAEVWSFSAFQPTAAVTANGAVYVGAADGNVYALNATTGAQIWAYSTGGIAVTGLAMSSGVVYAGYYVGHVVAIGAASGSQIWQVATCGSPSKPVVADGVMYDDCLSYGTTGNDVYALSAAYGYQQWTAAIGGNGDCAPALVTNGTVYVGCDDNLLHAYALPVLPGAVQRPNPAQLHPDWRLRAA